MNLFNIVNTFSSIISLAGRKEDIKLKYPNLNVDEIARNDPSGNHKYLSWMVGQLAGGANENDLYPTVQYYHRNTANFKHKDINKYITLKELEDELKDISEAKAGKEKDKEKFKARQEKLDQAKTVANSTLLFEDESVKLLRINNKEGAVVEGVGSRWCVSATESVNYFDRYNSSNVILYFLLRKNPEGNNFDKIAFAYQRDLENKIIEVDIFDKNDAGITDDIVSSVCPEYPKIKSIMDNEAPQLPDSILVKMKKGSADIEEVRKYLGALDGSELVLDLSDLNNKYKDAYIDYMKHPSNDIRRVVANSIDPSFLSQMMNDKASFIRKIVAGRIDPSFLPQMMNDKSANVRHFITSRIDPSFLPQMMNDKSSYVRFGVAKRIDPSFLPQMMNDKDRDVRQIVAKRIDPSFLHQMMNDEDSYVRIEVAKRIDPSFLPQMMNDKSWDVRYGVAKRIDPSFLLQMMNDGNNYVRIIITDRMNNIKSASTNNKIKSSIKQANIKDNLTYSSIMRHLNKHDKGKISTFMSSFKNAFDKANEEGLEDCEKLALMEAIQNADIDVNKIIKSANQTSFKFKINEEKLPINKEELDKNYDNLIKSGPKEKHNKQISKKLHPLEKNDRLKRLNKILETLDKK